MELIKSTILDFSENKENNKTNTGLIKRNCLIPVMGLTTEAANQKIANELQRVINEYKRQRDPKLKSFNFWNGVLLFVETREGFAFVLSILTFLAFEIVVYTICDRLFLNRLIEIVTTLVTLVPFVMAHIFVKTKLRRAELIRAFAQVEETHRLLTLNSSSFMRPTATHLPVSGLFSKHQIWNPPSSTVLSVFRDKHWVSIPSNMLADGDIFKLHVGHTFPVDAVRVRLVAVSCTNEATPVASGCPSVLVLPVIAPNSKYYKNGQVFEVNEDNNVEETSDWSDTSSGDGIRSVPVEDIKELIFDSEKQEEKLHFSGAVRRCIPLAIGTFLALSYPCTQVVSGFLSTALLTKGSSNRRNTKFFEMIRIIKGLLFFAFVILFLISVVMNLLWTLTFLHRRGTASSYSSCFKIVFIEGLWLHTILLALSFVPLIHDILVELTDVWGNARLQSLFQWLQDIRVPSSVENFQDKYTDTDKMNGVISGTGRGSREPHTDASSCETSVSSCESTWSSQDSLNDSVWSNMSVSQLPFRNQFVELLAVLSQGLDGPSNLLHTLNSTTSLVFVDEKGILTDTHRTVQEVCIPKEMKSDTYSPCLSMHRVNSDVDKHCNRVSPLSRPVAKLPYCTAALLDRVVLDVLSDEVARDGQRFENTFASEAFSTSLKPLVTLMAITKLPLSLTQYQDFSHSNWLFAQTLRDMVVSEGIFDEAYKECVCSLRSLAKVSNPAVSRLLLSRFMLLVQCRIQKSISPKANTKQSPRIRMTRQSNIVLCAWLTKDITTGSHQVVTKGDPRQILRRSVYYFNGEHVLLLSNDLRRSLLQIIDQWKGDGLECLAYSYRPLSKEQQYHCLHQLDEHSLFVIDPEITTSIISREDGLGCFKKPCVYETHDTTDDIRSRDIYSSSYCDERLELRRREDGIMKSICIFPGPRSSIGALPRVPYYDCLKPLSSGDDILYKVSSSISASNAYDATESGNLQPFFDYNNLLVFDRLLKGPVISFPCSSHGTHRSQTKSLTKKLHMHSCSKKLTQSKGSFLHRLLDKQVFLGMIALRLSTPQELAGRIQSFHEAGIRFVYMSREDDAKTKSVGCLLGLETDWNCLVSLEPVANRVVNAVGNVVVPSGIESIKAHIRDIDNVPLQVSLFSRGTPTSMRQMIKILQKNGEVVTCVGSARRCSNFLLFEQANCSISVSIDRPLLCRECLGRRCVGHINRHLFSTLPKEFEISAALSSLPCALHINISNVPQQDIQAENVLNTPAKSPSDPRWLLELLYEAFKESRRIVRAIEQSVFFFAGINMGFVAHSFFLVSVLFTPPFFHMTTIIFVNFICLPLIVITFLHNPAGENIMKEFPLRAQDHEEKKRDVWNTCFIALIQFLPSSFLCVAMLCDYFLTSVIAFAKLHIGMNTSSALNNSLQQCLSIQWMDMFFGRWLSCVESTYGSLDQLPASTLPPLLHTHLLGIFLFLLFSCTLSISFIDRTESLLCITHCRNMWLIFGWCIVFLFYIIITSVVLTVTDTWKFLVKPSLLFLVLLCCSPLCLITLNELIKNKERRKYKEKQKYLKLLFTTRLGMWSPR